MSSRSESRSSESSVRKSSRQNKFSAERNHVSDHGHARRTRLLVPCGVFRNTQLISPCARAAGVTAQRGIASDGASSCPEHGDARDHGSFRILYRARQSRGARRERGGRMRQRKLRHCFVGRFVRPPPEHAVAGCPQIRTGLVQGLLVLGSRPIAQIESNPFASDAQKPHLATIL